MKLEQALRASLPSEANAPDDLPFQFDAPTIKRGLSFTLMTDLGWIDFLGEVSGVGDYAAVKKKF
jgi:hypothetical protein